MFEGYDFYKDVYFVEYFGDKDKEDGVKRVFMFVGFVDGD